MSTYIRTVHPERHAPYLDIPDDVVEYLHYLDFVRVIVLRLETFQVMSDEPAHYVFFVGDFVAGLLIVDAFQRIYVLQFLYRERIHVYIINVPPEILRGRIHAYGFFRAGDEEDFFINVVNLRVHLYFGLSVGTDYDAHPVRPDFVLYAVSGVDSGRWNAADCRYFVSDYFRDHPRFPLFFCKNKKIVIFYAVFVILQAE